MTSLRVQRHDTGAWVSIPADSLRWGPNLGHSTCRAALLLESIDSVPYFLPFPGAKFAVRVTLPEKAGEQRAGDELLCCPTCRRPFALHAIGCPSRRELQEADRKTLGSLLEAAADALRSEAAEDAPDTLGRALELLAEGVDRRAYTGAEEANYRRRVRDFLEHQTSAQIRCAFPGLPIQDIETLRSAVAWLRSAPLGQNLDAAVCADRLCDLTDRLVSQGPADV